MDLRRRSKQHVMETMDGKTPAPRAHEFACAHGDFHVDGMDNMAEGRDETVEPLIQRVGAYCLASGYSSDCRLDFDDGGRREEKRVLVGLNPVSKAVRSPLARRQAFEQSSVNQPTCHRHFPCLMLVELEIDIKVMRKSQESPPEFRGVRRVVRSVGSFTLYGRDHGKRFAIVREDN